MLTSLDYLFLQIPSTFYSNSTHSWLVTHQHTWALWGLIDCVVCLVAYIGYQAYTADSETEGSQMARRDQVIKESISKGEMSLVGALSNSIRPDMLTIRRIQDRQYEHERGLELVTEATPLVAQEGGGGEATASDEEMKVLRRLKTIVRPIFQRYDISGNGLLDIEEFACVMRDLHEYRLSKQYGGRDIHELFCLFDTNRSGSITFHEFVLGLILYMKRYHELRKQYSPNKFTVCCMYIYIYYYYSDVDNIDTVHIPVYVFYNDK